VTMDNRITKSRYWHRLGCVRADDSLLALGVELGHWTPAAPIAADQPSDATRPFRLIVDAPDRFME
jgi:hypothetical protein